MKKMMKLVWVFLVFSVLLLVAGCANSPKKAEPVADSGKNDLIGICVVGADHGWSAALSYYAEKKAKELGLNYKLVTSSNANQQVSQMEELINLKSKAIVFLPHNNELDVIAQKVVDAGIPLINFDRKVNVNTTSYVAGNNYNMGVKSAEYIGKKLGGQGIIAAIEVPNVGSVNVERMEGFKKTIAEKFPNIKYHSYASNSMSREDALKVTPDVLTANPHLDAIFTIDDEVALGVYRAIKEQKRTDIKVITGGGGCQEYFNLMGSEKEIYLESATYSPAMIMDAVQIAADLVRNGKKPEKEVILDTEIVDRDNVAKYLDPNSPY